MTAQLVEVPCEVYSRIVGYLRPVQYWNAAKQAEFKDRVTFDMSKALKEEEEVLEVLDEVVVVTRDDWNRMVKRLKENNEPANEPRKGC